MLAACCRDVAVLPHHLGPFTCTAPLTARASASTPSAILAI